MSKSVKNDIKPQISFEMSDQIWRQVSKLVWHQVANWVWIRVQVWDQVYQVQDQVKKDDESKF